MYVDQMDDSSRGSTTINGEIDDSVGISASPTLLPPMHLCSLEKCRLWFRSSAFLPARSNPGNRPLKDQ